MSEDTPEGADSNFTGKERLEYAWKYFLMLTDQRLRTFHFYCIVIAAALAGTGTAFGQEKPSSFAFFIFGIAHFVLALVFGMTDRRSLSQIRDVKEVIKAMEKGSGNPPQLLNQDDTLPSKMDCYPCTYTGAIKLLCGAQVLLGVALLIYALSTLCSHY